MNDMLEQTVAKNIRLSKSLLGFSLKPPKQSYIIAANTADTWHKTSLKKLTINQKLKKWQCLAVRYRMASFWG